MNKRPFILIEVLLCVAILALCAIPIIGYPFYSFRERKEKLLQIEKERQAELIFFDLMKNIQHTHAWKEIGRAYSTKFDKRDLSVVIDGFGEVIFNTHTHLYHCHPDKNKSGYRKIHFKVCFEEKCNPYEFVFFARKKVEEKTLNETKEE